MPRIKQRRTAHGNVSDCFANMEGNRIGDSARENGWAIRYRKQDGFI